MKDVVIVLSHRLNPDGNFSLEYKKRLDAGIELILKNEAKHLLLCSETAIENVKDYVCAGGVLKSKILLEPFSRDSIGEAYFSKRDFLVPNNWVDIIVLSSDYHIQYRIASIFDFILGEKFNIDYIGVESGRLDDFETKEDQMRSLDLFEKIFGGIASGDDESIKNRFLAEHDLYKTN